MEPQTELTVLDSRHRRRLTLCSLPCIDGHIIDIDRVFTSALKQRIVRYRVEKICGINFDTRLHHPGPEECIRYIEEHAVTEKRTLRSRKVHELLTSVGGYRPHAEEVFPLTDGRCFIKELATQCLTDPQFVLDPSLGDKQKTSTKLLRAGLDPVSYSELVEVIKILKVWRDPKCGPGRNERFVGTLLDFFPKHNYAELEYMKQEWGNFGMLLRCSVVGYTEGDFIQAFGHPDNQVKKRRFVPSSDAVLASMASCTDFRSAAPRPSR